MENLSDQFRTRIDSWPDAAQQSLLTCRQMFHDIAAKAAIGPLEESLKWGQPAWRPKKPRTGSTLRMDWSPKYPTHLSLFVDCKTDLAARIQNLYPTFPQNDGRRHLAFPLAAPLPEQAIAHLAEMTFGYHRKVASTSD